MTRCPRCQGENDERAARCARCGAPLLLGEEPATRPLDRPLDLDRRGLPMPPTPGRPAGPPARAPVAPAPRSQGGASSPSRPALTPPWPVPLAAAPPPARSAAPRAPTATAPVPAPPPTAARPPVAAPRRPVSAGAATPASIAEARPALPAPLDLDPDVQVDRIEILRRRAAPWRRLASWAVDGLLLGLLAAPIIWLVLSAAGPAAAAADLDGLLALAARQGRYLVPTLAFVALAAAVYSALSVALMGATPGKRLLGLEVVGRDGRRPSPRRAVARAALTLLSFSLLGLGCLLALFTRSGRALHDFLAGTLVVER